MKFHKIFKIIVLLLLLPFLGTANSQNIDVTTQSYTFPVALEQETTVEGINLVIEFDENNVQFVSATLIDGFLSAWQSYIQVIQYKGFLSIAISGDQLITGSGDYIFITFDIIGDVGNNSLFNIKKMHCNGNPATGGFNINDDPLSLSLNMTISEEIQDINITPPSYIIPVALSHDTLIEGINLVLTYDQNMIQYKSSTLEGGILEAWNDYLQVITIDGLVSIAISGDHLISGNGEFIYISFDVIGNINDQSVLNVKKLSCNGSPSTGGIKINDNDITKKVNLKIEGNLFVENEIEDIHISEDSEPTTITLTNLFSDARYTDAVIVKNILSNSNPGLVSANLNGDTLFLNYKENKYGSSIIYIQGTSSGLTVDYSFTVNVNSVNDAPFISNISDLVILKNTVSVPVNLTVTDVENNPDTLSLSVKSSNKDLLSTDNIIVNGIGTNRILTLTPTANESGSLTLTVIASDGSLTTTRIFSLIIQDVFERALYFDGINNFVNAYDQINIDHASFTIEFFAKKGNGSHGLCMVSQGSLLENSLLDIGYYNSNRIRFGFFGENTIETDQQYPESKWHHLAFTFDSLSQKASIYVDGNLVKTDMFTSKYIGRGNFYIGQYATGGNRFQGEIDELRVWNKALSQEQIYANMCKSINKNINGLIAYYSFNKISDKMILSEYTPDKNIANLINMNYYKNWIASTAPIGSTFYMETGSFHVVNNDIVPFDVNSNITLEPLSLHSSIQIIGKTGLKDGLINNFAGESLYVWFNDDTNADLNLKYHFDHIGGIINENDLIIYTRSPDDNTWVQANNISVDTEGNNTDGKGYINIQNVQSTSLYVLASNSNLNTFLDIPPIPDQNIDEDTDIIEIPFKVFNESTSITFTTNFSNDSFVSTYNITPWVDAKGYTLSLAPETNMSGLCDITLTIVDYFNFTASEGFSLNIIPVNDSPEIISTPETIAIEDEFYSYTLIVSDIDNDIISYTALNLPSWMSMNQLNSKVLLYGTPDDEDLLAPNNVVIEISDGTVCFNYDYTISVLSVNDFPIVTAWSDHIKYTENDIPQLITNNININDNDSDKLISASISISEFYQKGEDFLLFNDTNSISGIWNEDTGTLSLSGSDSLENYQTAIKSILYNNISEKPNTQTRTLTCIVNDGFAESLEITKTVGIISVNDAPVLNDFIPTLASINEDNNASQGNAIYDFISSANISDPDGNQLTSIVIFNVDQSMGQWQYSLDNGTSWANFALLTQTSDISEQAVLLDGSLIGQNTNRIRFVPMPNTNGVTDLSFRAWDKSEGITGSRVNLINNIGGTTAFSLNFKKATLTVNPVNDIPKNIDITKTGNEDITCYFTASDFTQGYTDIDHDVLAKIKVTELPSNGLLSLNDQPLSVNDDIFSTEMAQLSFVPYTGWYGETSFKWQASDGTSWALTPANAKITIIADPVDIDTISKIGPEDIDIQFDSVDFANFELDSSSYIQAVSLPEEGSLMFDPVKTSQSHPFSGTAVTAGQEFYINDLLAGDLVYRPDNNFNGYDEFLWRASKNNEWSANELVKITITPENDPPILKPMDQSIDEDNVLSFNSSNFSSSFDDVDGNILNAIKITCLPEHGELKLSNSTTVNIDDVINVDNIINLTYSPYTDYYGLDILCWNGSDGNIYAESQAMITITVNPFNDLPVIQLADISKIYTENAPPVYIAKNSKIVDPDLMDYDTGSLTVSIQTNSADSDFLTVNNQSPNENEIWIQNSEIFFTYNAQTKHVATYSGGQGINNPLHINFNSNSNVSAVSAVLKQISYKNISENPGDSKKVIEIIANDGDGGISQPVEITLNMISVNDPPEAYSIPDCTLAEGKAITIIDLSKYVVDPDNTVNQMNWIAKGFYYPLSITIENNNATIKSLDKDWNGEVGFDLTVSDPQGLTDLTGMIFKVTPINDPPVISEIPELAISEGSNFTPVNLDNFVQDIDNLDMDIVWTVNEYTPLTILIENRILNVQLPDINWNGSEKVELIATDPDGLTHSTIVQLEVKPVNDPPVVLNIPDIKFSEGLAYTQIHLNSFVNDIDNSNNDIQWSVSNSYPFTVTIFNDIVRIAPPHKDWQGSDNIILVAKDPLGLTDYANVNIEVINVNDQPVLSPISNFTIAEGKNLTPVNLSDYITDIDTDLDQIVWTNSISDVFSITITQQTLELSTIDKNYHGVESFSITATDSGALSDSIEITIIVVSVNDPPQITPMREITVSEGQNITPFTLNDYVFDPDHAKDQIHWTAKGSSSLTVNIIQQNTAVIELKDENWNGQASVLFVANDPENLTSASLLTINVLPVNDYPEILPIPEQITSEGKPFTNINLNNYIVDVDNNLNEFYWESTSTNISITIVNGILMASPKDPNWNGSEKISLKASDNYGAPDMREVIFTVQPENDPPVFISTPEQFAIEDSFYSYTIVAQDIDGKYLSYSITKLPPWLKYNEGGYGTVSTIVGTNGESGDSGENGLAKNAKINNPNGISFDRWGNLFFADLNNYKIKRVDIKTGIIKTLAGTTEGYYGDAGKALQAKLNTPYKLYFDIDNNLLFSDRYNHRIRKIDLITNIINTTAGSNTSDYTGDNGEPLSAGLNNPVDVIMDRNNNIYISDSNHHCIRKIDADTGLISTFAGTGSNAGDLGDGGDARNAVLSFPSSLDIDTDGNIYIADLHHYRIRKIDAKTNIISTVAGSGIVGDRHNPSTSGDGALATDANLYYIEGFCVDVYKNIYIADGFRVRKVDAITNIITTIAGHTKGNIDNVKADQAGFYSLSDINIDYNGNLFVSEYQSHVIRKIEKLPSTITGTPGDAATYTSNWVEIQVHDGIAHSTQRFTITVQNINDPPKISGISDFSISEGENFTEIHLDTILNDPDNSFEQIEWTISQPGSLSVSISNNIVSISTPDENYNGSETICFTAKDPEGLTDSFSITFTVKAINDPPQLSDLAPLIVSEGEHYTPILLDDLVFDIDNTDNEINWLAQNASAITLSISQDRILSARALDENWNGSETLTFIAIDPQGLTDSIDIVFTVLPVNNAPDVIMNKGLILAEGENSIISKEYLKSTDIDNEDSSLIYTLKQLPENGSILQSNTILTLNEKFTQSDIDNNLVKYNHSGNESETDSFVFTVSDVLNAETENITFNIVIIPENDTPTISGWSESITYVENFPSIEISDKLNISDPDDNYIEKAIITISENYAPDEDMLLFEQTSLISAQWDTISGALNLTGTASLSDYETAIKSVQYINNSEKPSDLARTLSCIVNDGYADSQVITQTLFVLPMNDRPIMNIHFYTLTTIVEDEYTNNGNTIAEIFPENSISDPDGEPVTAIAVNFVDNTFGIWQYSLNNGESWINFTDIREMFVHLDDTVRLLDGTLTGSNTNRIRFVPDPNYYGESTFSFYLWDKQFGMAGDSVFLYEIFQFESFSYDKTNVWINILFVNDIPEISSINKNGNEDSTCYFTASEFVSNYTDLDNDILSEIIPISLPANGVLKLSDTAISINDRIKVSDIERMSFVPNANWYGNTNFEWKASDGNSWSLTALVNIYIDADPVNIDTISKTGNEDEDLQFDQSDLDGFELDATSYIQAVSLPDDGTLMFDPLKTTQSHPFSGTPVTMGQEFHINEITAGELIYRPNNNFNGYAEFYWRASKNDQWSDNELVKITILPDNDKPVIGNFNISGDEDNSIQVKATDFTSVFTDDDGNIISSIRIDCLPENGRLENNGSILSKYDEVNIQNLSIKYIPNDNFNGTNHFCWNANDGEDYADEYAMVTITIKAVNDSPILTLTENVTVYTENNLPVAIDNAASIIDVDSINFDNATLTIEITQNKTENDRLTICNQGSNNCEITTENHNVIFTTNEGQLIIGTCSTTSSSLLKITFNQNADLNAVNSLLRNITFANVSENPTYTNKELSLLITDGDGGQSQLVTKKIVIIPQNDPPVLVKIPDQTIAEGSTFSSILLNNFVSDFDHTANQLVWTAGDSNSLDISIVNRVVTITLPNENYNGTETISFTVTDPGGLSDYTQVKFTVTPVNDPPQVSGIMDQTVSEDTAFSDINLDNFVNDPDNYDENISWAASGAKYLSVTIIDRIAQIIPKEDNWFGVENLTFIASDPDGLTHACQALFTVLAVNDPPVISGTFGQYIYTEDHSGNALITNLTISDVDDTIINKAVVAIASNYENDKELIHCNNSEGLNIDTIENANGYTLILTGNATLDTYETALNSIYYTYIADDPNTVDRSIYFVVSDGKVQSNRSYMTVSIVATDDPPKVVSPIDLLTYDEDSPSVDIQLTNVFLDPDNDTDIVKSLISNSNTSLLTASVSGNLLHIDFKENAHGDAKLVIRCLSNGLFVDESVDIIVNSVDDPLQLANPLDDVEVNEDASPTTISLEDLFSDADHDKVSILKAIQSNNNENLLSATIFENTLKLNYKENKNGNATIIVRGFSDGTTVDDTFKVIVNAIDDPPVVHSGLEPITVDEDSPSINISVLELFTDIDNDDSTIAKSVYSSSNKDLLEATIIQDELILSFNKDQFGNTELVIRGTSNGKTVDHSIDITVNQIDDPPYILNKLKPKKLVEDATSVSIALTHVFTDPDSDDSLIVKSILLNTNPEILDANIAGNILSITPIENQYGNISLTIKALSESEFVTDTLNIEIYAVDDPPFVKNQLNDISTEEDHETLSISLDKLFSDIDNDDQAINIEMEVSTAKDFFAITLNEKTLTINPKLNLFGAASVTLIGTSGNKKVEDTFIYKVNQVNDLPVFTTTPIVNAIQGVNYRYDFAAIDVDGDTITYKTQLLPSWLTFVSDENGNRIKGLPETDGFNDNNKVILEAYDGKASQLQSYTLTLISRNYSPVISDISEQTINEGQDFSPIILDNYVSDPNNSRDEMTWTFNESRALNIDITNRIVSINTKNIDWNGSEDVLFTVTDPTGLTDTVSIRFNVISVNDPPEIESDPVLEAIAGVKYIYNIMMSDRDFDALTVNPSTLPSWLNFEEKYGNITTVNKQNISNISMKFINKIALDNLEKTIYIADSSSNCIFKLDIATGDYGVFAGTGRREFNGDNKPAKEASLAYPGAVSVDKEGNVYISDYSNNRIRKVDSFSGYITTIAGNGTSGSAVDGQKAINSRISNPGFVLVGPDGAIYFSESSKYIRKVKDGIISTFYTLGSGPQYLGDLAFDPEGNNWISYIYSRNQNIIKRDYISNNSTTILNKGRGYNGDGRHISSTQFFYASSLRFDTFGNLYISDSVNRRVRKVDANTMIVQTIAGTGRNGNGPDNIPATSSMLGYPLSTIVDSKGNVYIGDSLNKKVRKIEKLYQLVGTPTREDISKDNTVILNISDGTDTTKHQFEINISENAPPTISAIDNQETAQDVSTQTINFSIDDIDTPVNQLTVNAVSDNLALVQNDQILIQGTGTGRNIKITPQNNAFGTVNITLSVNDGELTTSESFMLTIHARPYATINIAENYTTCATSPMPVMFSPTNVMHDITSWLWDFGDGNTSTEMKPTHTYLLNKSEDNPSNYTVTLTVSGPGGESTEYRSSYISVKDIEIIDFSSNIRKGIIPHEVLFFDQSINVNGDFLWDFGDGSQSSTAYATSHTYTEPGMYTVTLTIGNNTISKSNYISAEGRNISGFVYGSDTGQGLSGYFVELQLNNKNFASLITDSNGYYDFKPLPASANYILSVWPPPETDKYYSQYFSGATTPFQATKISTVFESRQDINLTLERRPVYGISGQVIFYGGTPVKDFEITAYSVELRDGLRGTTDENGYYTITGLGDASDYRVYFFYDDYDSEFYYKTADESVVSFNDASLVTPKDPVLENINIVIKERGTISGQIKNGNILLQDVWVNAWSEVLKTGNGALSDENGNYTITGLTGTSNSKDVTYIVEVLPLRYPYQIYNHVQDMELATPVLVNTKSVNFNLKTGSTIAGHIKNESGEPVSYVPVIAMSEQYGYHSFAISDFYGCYSLTDLRPAEDYVVSVYPFGYMSQTYFNTLDVRINDFSNIDFILDKGPVISGHVYIEDFIEPAPQGIWVSVWSDSTQSGGEAVTDENGMYEISGLDSTANDYIISIYETGYIAAYYNSDKTVYKVSSAEGVSPSESDHDIVLITGFKISGKVLFNNEPISGIRIEAWAEDVQCWASTVSVDSTTNENNFTLDGLLPGTYEISFISDIYSPETLNNIVVDDSDINNISQSMEKFERSISGTVYGLKQDRTVTIYAWSDAIKSGNSISLNGNGSDQLYTISGLKPSYDYKVQLMSPDQPNQYYKNRTNWNNSDLLDLSSNDAANIDFDLNIETVTISGNVTFPNNAKSGDDVWIDALVSSTNILKKSVRLIFSNNHTVAYELSGIEKDKYIIYAHSDRFKRIYYDNTSSLQNAKIIDGRNIDTVENINFDLTTGAKISGIVTVAYGKGASGIRVEAFSYNSSTGGSTSTIDSGVYSIEGLDSAVDFKVSATKQGEAAFYYNSDGTVRNRADASLINTVDLSEHSNINISLSVGQSISGTVNTIDGKPVAGVWVTASSEINNIENSERTDDDGFFEISGLTPGYDYKVSVKPSCSSVFVPDEKTNISTDSIRVNFYLSQGHNLSGYVTAKSSGKALSQVEIKVISSKTNYFCTSTSDLNGQYNITGLPDSDDYIIAVIAPEDANFQNESLNDLTVNKDTTVNFTLKSALTITGYIYESGTQTVVKSAKVKISSNTTQFRSSTTSDEKGFYQLNNIPDAFDYAFMITHEDYADYYQTGQSAGSEITFYLEKGGVISGEIIDENAPFSDALVKVLSPSLNIIKETYSDENGQYRVDGLIAYKNNAQVIDYWVSVEASGYPSHTKGQNKVGDVVNFKLDRSDSNQITGTVSDSINQLLPDKGDHVKIKVYSDGKYVKNKKINRDGTGIFVIKGLKSGVDYKLKVCPSSSSNMPTEWIGSDGIGVSDENDAAIFTTGKQIHFKFSKGTW